MIKQADKISTIPGGYTREASSYSTFMALQWWGGCQPHHKVVSFDDVNLEARITWNAMHIFLGMSTKSMFTITM